LSHESTRLPDTRPRKQLTERTRIMPETLVAQEVQGDAEHLTERVDLHGKRSAVDLERKSSMYSRSPTTSALPAASTTTARTHSLKLVVAGQCRTRPK
jgi:hypothetical protein